MFKFVSTKNINELFQRAILHNDIQRTKLILEEAMKDPRFNIDQINEEGLTALQYSCFAGNLEIVKVLAGYNANWKIRDRDGYTLMHASAMAGMADVMRYLLLLGLKPTLKTDDGLMPIDVTDEISIIVILLRSMLDQGYLQEMQDYMMDHPKLKRNIFKELEKVKCREQEKENILNEMPYTSHSLQRKKQAEKAKRKTKRDGLRRSTSTFSELSDSIQQLDKLDPSQFTDYNNNECGEDDPFPPPPPDVDKRSDVVSRGADVVRSEVASRGADVLRSEVASRSDSSRSDGSRSVGSRSDGSRSEVGSRSHSTRSDVVSRTEVVTRTDVVTRAEIHSRSSGNESDTQTLKRENSFSSSSSHSSKSSHRSGNGGILRNNRPEPSDVVDHSYRNTQQYLENRFPSVNARPKSVTFDFAAEKIVTRKYSEGRPSTSYDNTRISGGYDEKIPNNTRVPPNNTRVPPLPNTQTNISTYSDVPISVLNEPLYENAAHARARATMPSADSPRKILSEVSDKKAPPPLPPRAPTTQLSDGLRLNHVSYNTKTSSDTTSNNINYDDRQLGSETDSGIDVNETAGRVFALSVNDRNHADATYNNRNKDGDQTYKRNSSYQAENYSKPIGLYYSEQLKAPLARQQTQDDEPPCSFAVRTNNNQKYMSWNGYTYHDQLPLTPYQAHARNENYYDTRYSDASSNTVGRVKRNTAVRGSDSEASYHTGVAHNTAEPVDFTRYDFDNQPEIML